jgi:hypothetical protein
MTNCLPLNSCTSQFLTLEVIDTTSGITLPDPETQGIRVFPNPAKDIITIAAPGIVNSVHFDLFNVHGQIVASEEIRSEVSTFSVSELPRGMYSLQVRNASENQYFRALRIVIAD